MDALNANTPDEPLDSRRELVQTQLRLERVQRKLASLHEEYAAQMKHFLADLTHTRHQRDDARVLTEKFTLDLGQLEKVSAGNSSLKDELSGARRDAKNRKVDKSRAGRLGLGEGAVAESLDASRGCGRRDQDGGTRIVPG